MFVIRLVRVVTAVVFCWFAGVATASAHPLGNFTINHLSTMTVSRDAVNVRYDLDMAEFPSFSEARMRTANGKLAGTELARWGRDTAAALAPQLVLTADNARSPAWSVSDVHALARPGAGGLQTLHLEAIYTTTLPTGTKTIAYEDRTYPGRLGWRDVVTNTHDDPTHGLLAYPNALLASPPDRTTLTATLAGSGAIASATFGTVADAPPPPSAGSGLSRSNVLGDLVGRKQMSIGVILFTLLVAIGLGALHALEPGHGKTLLAISLVGARATVSQAAILAGALTVAHTVAVIALGVAIEVFKGQIVPERVYPWITLASGIAIAIIGARSIQRHVLGLRPREHAHVHAHDGAHPHVHEHVHSMVDDHHDAALRQVAVGAGAAHGTDAEIARRLFTTHAALHATGEMHDHGPGGHTHGPGSHTHGPGGEIYGEHDHSSLDDEAHALAHAIPGTEPLKFGPAVWAAMSGGIAPCPAALVVLLAAISLDRVTFGIVVVIAFSLGLAGTLTGLGIAVVRGATLLRKHRGFDNVVKYGPIASAVLIATIGAIMVGQGMVENGIRVSALAVTALTGLAILGFAFSHGPTHRKVNA